MLTPQEISEMQFAKAVFGGYDMSAVDTFMERAESDFAALVKENAILKSKIKVLVEKVEEYRATEDSMRMALLTAQKMGDELVSEAAKQKSTIIASAEEEISARKEQIEQQTDEETRRLEDAKAATTLYAGQVRRLLGEMERKLLVLEDMSRTEQTASVPEAAPETPDAPAEAPAEDAPAAEEPPQQPAPAQESAPAPIVDPMEFDDPDVARILAAAQATVLADEGKAAEAPAQESAPAAPAAPAAPIDPDDDEPVTPRPKFDFQDLQFGTNFNTQK